MCAASETGTMKARQRGNPETVCGLWLEIETMKNELCRIRL